MIGEKGACRYELISVGDGGNDEGNERDERGE